MAQIPQVKTVMIKVPLYYYAVEYNQLSDSGWLAASHHMFKTTKKAGDLTEDMVAKALGIRMGKNDCLAWWPVKPDEYFKNLVEV